MRVESSLSQSYEQLASGSRINSASDDAAGLAISQKMTSEIEGTNQGTQNAADMKNLVDTAEGALDSIHDNLHRMRELSVQASNGILSSSDKGMIQKEIAQIKEQIGEQVKNTEFNTQKLIDGSFIDKNVASNASGSGIRLSIENTGLEELGIKDFDVTQNFSIEDIDDAINKVSTARGDLGATSNRLDHTINYNQVAVQNQAAAKSGIEDLDFAQGISSHKANEALLSYQLAMQQAEMGQESNKVNMLF